MPVPTTEIGRRLARWQLTHTAPAHLSIDHPVQADLAAAADKLDAAKKAADAILAPLTMEVGRLLEENPGADVLIVCFGEEIKLTAKHFMDLYDTTDF
jgi:hypothetical protein